MDKYPEAGNSTQHAGELANPNFDWPWIFSRSRVRSCKVELLYTGRENPIAALPDVS
jgi:hypothetical protein